MVRRGVLGLALLLFALALGLLSRRGHDLEPGRIEGARVPAAVRAQWAGVQTSDGAALATSSGSPAEAARKQILFGDLHVHTTYSIDAFVFSLPIFASEGVHPPADACDFARYCSALDFFSINDHAESLTPERWRATLESLRECNARAGDPSDPDLVAFVGWEWTQVGSTPEQHWGHKNVIVPGLSDAEVPPRPIAFLPESELARAPNPLLLRGAESLLAWLDPVYADFVWWIERLARLESCPHGVDSRALPPDCRETADTPAELFEKLAQWGGESLVIPHGLAWGIHAPPAARLDNQLTAEQHDSSRQRLLEIFSGHGNGEEYRSWLDRPAAGTEPEICPPPSEGFLACCWQAGEIMRRRCGDLPAPECEARVERARRLALEAGVAPQRVFPDASMEEWLDCDQCRDCFKPALHLRAGESAQYGLALSRFEEGQRDPLRFRWGFIASSDNHLARAATGYKQFARTRTTDARGVQSARVEGWLQRVLAKDADVDPREPRPVEHEPRSFQALLEKERGASFMYPGGLVAVHAEGRDRRAIWSALVRREVYGTSGPRLLLWFDLLNAGADRLPMGSEARLAEAPRFEVRALGARRQLPGCPDHARSGLSAERLAALCLGECHHPGDSRHAITAIEVVRVRPQRAVGDAVAPRIEDPWRRFECPPDPARGCSVRFEDPDFVADGGDAVYYVRALQEPTDAINGANLRAERGADGRVVSTRPCYGDWRTPDSDLCLAPVQERAWSSPIFVDRL